MITKDQICDKLIFAIRNSGKSQTYIAQKLNVKESMITHYISGKEMPLLDKFAYLCELLELDVNEILC